MVQIQSKVMRVGRNHLLILPLTIRFFVGVKFGRSQRTIGPKPLVDTIEVKPKGALANNRIVY